MLIFPVTLYKERPFISLRVICHFYNLLTCLPKGTWVTWLGF